VTDSQGPANIESVLLTAIVDGRESPPWPMGRVPLAFPSGDPSVTLLYDDGTHGEDQPGHHQEEARTVSVQIVNSITVYQGAVPAQVQNHALSGRRTGSLCRVNMANHLRKG
jgi:hypothetical protein